MAEVDWGMTNTPKERPEYKWNEREWTNKNNDNFLFIVQPKLTIELYELWDYCPNHDGDRYDNNTYKCVSTFETLEAAKAAYLIYESALP
jgi:hypothetical protein